MKSILFIILIALSGCATTGTNAVIQKVEIPVGILCLTPEPNVPVFNFDSLKTTDTLFTKTKNILADRELHIGYETVLLAALRSCK